MTTELNLEIPNPDVVEFTPLAEQDHVFREAPTTDHPMRPTTPSL